MIHKRIATRPSRSEAKQLMPRRHVGATILLVALFVFFGTIGIALSMTPGHHGKIIDCPFMEHMETVCPMTLPQHLSAWQVMFRAIPVQNMMALLFLVFSVALFFIFIHPPQHLALRIFHRDKNPLHGHFPSKILRFIE